MYYTLINVPQQICSCTYWKLYYCFFTFLRLMLVFTYTHVSYIGMLWWRTSDQVQVVTDRDWQANYQTNSHRDVHRLITLAPCLYAFFRLSNKNKTLNYAYWTCQFVMWLTWPADAAIVHDNIASGDAWNHTILPYTVIGRIHCVLFIYKASCYVCETCMQSVWVGAVVIYQWKS